MKAVAFPAAHRHARVSGGQWLSMTIAVGLAACASPADGMPPELGDCVASGDAACTSEPAAGGGGSPSQGGVSGAEGGTGTSTVTNRAAGADGAASGGNGAGVADGASVQPLAAAGD
jgi:hypothetical protein